jgi:hypothetical protein
MPDDWEDSSDGSPSAYCGGSSILSPRELGSSLRSIMLGIASLRAHNNFLGSRRHIVPVGIASSLLAPRVELLCETGGTVV